MDIKQTWVTQKGMLTPWDVVSVLRFILQRWSLQSDSWTWDVLKSHEGRLKTGLQTHPQMLTRKVWDW